MSGLISFLPLLFFVFVVVSLVRNAAKVAQKMRESSTTPPRAAEFDPELAQRTRRIQEEIRRKIAERRGPLVPEPSPLVVTPRYQPPIIVEEDDPIPPPIMSEPASAMPNQSAILERQQRLADEMRALELARATGQRRAVQAAAALKSESASERGLLTSARASLVEDLRDPSGLRRALVLREILGPPVGLR